MKRKEIKKKISEAIEMGKRTIILWALGGYGKSYIAQQYCDDSVLGDRGFIVADDDLRTRLNDLYDSDDVFLRMSVEDTENSHGQHVAYDNIRDGVFARKIYSELDEVNSGGQKGWVIVYDDVTKSQSDFEEFIREFKYVPRKKNTSKGLVIITTQNCWGYDKKNDKNVEVISVEQVIDDEATTYLREAIPDISGGDIKNIISATGGIALPLRIVGDLICTRVERDCISVSDAVASFCKEVTLADAKIPRGIGYDKNLYSAIHVTVNNMRRLERNGDDAYDLLVCSAMTAAKQFERQNIFTKALMGKDWENEHIILAGWSFFENDKSFNLHATTQDILLRIDYSNNPEDYYKRLCRVAEAFITSLCEVDTNRRDGCFMIYASNGDNKHTSEFETAKRIQQLLNEAVLCSESSDSYLPLCDYLYRYSYAIAYYYYVNTNNYRDRELYYKVACEAIDKLLEKRPDDIMLLYKKAAQNKFRGVTLRALDRNDEGISCLDEAISIYNRIAIETNDVIWHTLAAEAYYNRGLVKSDIGNDEDVYEDYSASIKIAEEHALDKTKAIATRCIGIYYRDTGKYGKAIRCFEKSRKYVDMENKARCSTCLGLLYAMTGEWGKSEYNSKLAIEQFKEVKKRVSYNPYLNLELCYRKQGKKEDSKSNLMDASGIVFGDTSSSISAQFKSILDEENKVVVLEGQDYNLDSIACMLLCTHCVEYLITFSDSISSENQNIHNLLDLAFDVRDKRFRKLKDDLISLGGESCRSIKRIKRAVKSLTKNIVYNKLTCAALMLTCAHYYKKCNNDNMSIVFAYAALNLYSGYNYAYGIETTKRLLEEIEKTK